ncbi:MAG: globin domain-containing protein [Gammaproteobacteria bacterium]|nr:globin domain-containing protein [Gammaproteobacteria bacterium]
MDSRQKDLVKDSWEKLRPDVDRAAELFYTRLFEENPTLRELFRGELGEQGKRLMTMLGTAVGKLDQLEAVTPMLHELGRRHEAYGVRAEHYETFQDALMWTLQNVLGADFYPEVEDAWGAFYETLSRAMIDGAEKAA